uniref:Cadherin 18 n=1 Tax=Cyprinus carpio carpio TaxID=630221 RepID=A0A9J7XT65_CYPCA
MRAASSPACLSPLLLCLCVLQRSYGTPSPPSPTFTHNQTKLPDGDKDSHHRPKRGWIWNQFFVLEEHIGPDAQYVGKVSSGQLCRTWTEKLERCTPSSSKPKTWPALLVVCPDPRQSTSH